MYTKEVCNFLGFDNTEYNPINFSIEENIALPSIVINIGRGSKLTFYKKFPKNKVVKDVDKFLNSDLKTVCEELNSFFGKLSGKILQEGSIQIRYIPNNSTSPKGVSYDNVSWKYIIVRSNLPLGVIERIVDRLNIYSENAFFMRKQIDVQCNGYGVFVNGVKSQTLQYDTLRSMMMNETIKFSSLMELITDSTYSSNTNRAWNDCIGFHIIKEDGKTFNLVDIEKVNVGNQESDFTRLPFDLVLTKFIRYCAYKYNEEKDVNFIAPIKYAEDYLEAITSAVKYFYKEEGLYSFMQNGITSESLIPKSLETYIADVSLEMIKDKEVVELCKTNELFKALYRLYVATFRTYIQKDKFTIQISDNDYNMFVNLVIKFNK